MEGEKQEFLKREEVKTMSSDIARLREQEAKTEADRIAALKAQEKRAEQPQSPSNLPLQNQERKMPDFPASQNNRPLSSLNRPGASFEQRSRPFAEQQERPPFSGQNRFESAKWPKETAPERPSSFNKIAVRLGMSVVILLIFTNIFLFWNWYIREESSPKLTGPPPQEQPPAEQPPVQPPPVEPPPSQIQPPIIIPTPLIATEASATLEISSSTELSFQLSQILQKPFSTKPFTRILIKNTDENKLLNLEGFLQEFATSAPAEFKQKLDNDFTLFAYSQQQGNRLGYVAKIADKQGFAELLFSWQKTMEQDLDKLFSLFNKQGPALVPYFRQTAYKGALVYYQTFSKQDLGICYAILNNYFVFSTSWQSLLRTIDKLVEDL